MQEMLSIVKGETIVVVQGVVLCVQEVKQEPHAADG